MEAHKAEEGIHKFGEAEPGEKLSCWNTCRVFLSVVEPNCCSAGGVQAQDTHDASVREGEDQEQVCPDAPGSG